MQKFNFNNNVVKEMKYNNQDVEKCVVNGVVVFEKESEATNFKFTVLIPSGDLTFIIPFGTGECDCIVNWGDGKTTQYMYDGSSPDTEELTHNYSSAGEYQITVDGVSDNFGFSSSSSGKHSDENKEKVISIDTIFPKGMCDERTDFGSLFYKCVNLVSVPKELFINTKIEEFDNAFYKCEKLETVPSGFFKGCSNLWRFVQVFYLSGIKTLPDDLFSDCPNITDLTSAFRNCTSLDFDITNMLTNLNMAKVTTSTSMFRGSPLIKGQGMVLVNKPKDPSYTVSSTSGSSSYRTFGDCTLLSDYNSIPSAYK